MPAYCNGYYRKYGNHWEVWYDIVSHKDGDPADEIFPRLDQVTACLIAAKVEDDLENERT